MKRITALLMAILLTFAMCIIVSASEPEKANVRLSELSEEECIAFVKSMGLEIPEELTDYQSLGAFIKNVIATIEANPDYQFVINYPVTYEFANQVKSVVNSYYGITCNQASSANMNTRTYPLQYSTLHGSWLDEYYGYNCYSYAIGQTRPFDGYEIRHFPGCFNTSTVGTFSIDMPVGEMAELTVSDLNSLDYSCVTYSTSYSEIVALSNTHTIICLRKCSTPGLEDYHYMKLFGSMWLHKPGLTHVLKLNSVPGESVWKNEGVRPNEFFAGDRYYTGTIYYFAFRSSHGDMQELGRTGNHYHSGSKHYFEYSKMCEDCGTIIEYWVSQACGGPPCAVQIGSIKPEEFKE